jgi:L-asparaginase II
MEPLVEVLRAGRVESVHRGALALVEGDAPLLLRGDVERDVYYRSTSKPLQALVAVTCGAADALGIDDEELALAAGSHNAEPRQLDAATRILAKAGLDVSALGCGGHYSIDPQRARRQQNAVDRPPAIWSNCSGKHAMMLATAKFLGHPTESYLDPDHPVQRIIREQIATLAGIRPDEVRVGVDNCGAPAFALPLLPMAISLARFARPAGLPESLERACRRVANAMLAHPDMVGGRGRFDTDVMATCGNGVVAKAGAEGVHGWAVVGRGLAMAVKVEDGRDRGYRLLVVEALERFGLLPPERAAGLRARQAEPILENWAGRGVGALRVAVPEDAWPRSRG